MRGRTSPTCSDGSRAGRVRAVRMQQLDDLLRDSAGLSGREVVERIIGRLGDEAACVRSAGSTRCPMTDLTKALADRVVLNARGRGVERVLRTGAVRRCRSGRPRG